MARANYTGRYEKFGSRLKFIDKSDMLFIACFIYVALVLSKCCQLRRLSIDLYTRYLYFVLCSHPPLRKLNMGRRVFSCRFNARKVAEKADYNLTNVLDHHKIVIMKW